MPDSTRNPALVGPSVRADKAIMCDEDLSQRHRLRTVSIFLFFVCALSAPCVSYSVLTHEEVVDLLWEHPIRDLLLQRFPDATPENLRRAHAYAYGGCLIQDMGY